MARGRLSEEEIAVLRQNPYVHDVSDIGIQYTNEFKFHFMKEYLAGKKPTQIFREAGFDTTMLGSKRIERASQRWRESYESGSLGSYRDANYRSKYRLKAETMLEGLSYDECISILTKYQEEIERLQTENELLRKTLSTTEVFTGESR